MSILPAPPAPPLASTAVVQVHVRRSSIDRLWGSVLAVSALLLLLPIVGAAVAIDEAAWIVLVPVAPAAVVWLGMIGLVWRSQRSVTTPIELSSAGLVLRMPQGEVRCPWGAVAAMGFGRYGFTRTLVVRLHPQAGPGVPGIETTLRPRAWRVIHRSGLRYAAWLLDITDIELADAIARASAGQVHLAARA